MKRIKVTVLVVTVVLLVCSLALSQEKKPVDPVNWRAIVPFLIDFDGWTADGPASGQSVSMMDFKMSNAERSYTSGDLTLKITITDGAYAEMAYAAIQMAMSFEMDNSDEYLKKVTVKGVPGYEHYTYADRHAEVMLVAAERFIIQLEGDNFEDSSEMVAIAEKLDLQGIADLGK